jgi:hypothetical protein
MHGILLFSTSNKNVFLTYFKDTVLQPPANTPVFLVALRECLLP